MAQSETAASSLARPGRVFALARRIRSAVLAADHAKAGLLLQEYAETLSALWGTMPQEERESSDLPQLSLDLFTWARQATLIHRSLTAEHLAVMQKARRYHRPHVGSALHVAG
jgi:hypothetical protein